MSSLAASQQALLTTLFAAGRNAPEIATEFIAAHAHQTSARGLNAYTSNAHSLAERSLASVYPVLAQLLGDESFAAFARAFWHAHPPQRGDLAHWGDALTGFIAASPQLADVPYLADVARVEWALHQAATAPDAEADLATLHHLMEQDPALLYLRLAPGVKLVPSDWPVVSIVHAHGVAEGSTPDFSRVRERLHSGSADGAATAETALVWRQGFKPQVREALTGEPAFVAALQAGHTLDKAFSAIDTLDFAVWLPQAVSTGLLLAVDCLTLPLIP